VVISYLTRTNIISRVALCGTKWPLVATEHNVTTLNDAPMQVVWRTMRRLLYRHMTQVVTVSEGLAKQYRWLRPDKLSVIHNFLPERRGAEPEAFPFLSPGARYIVGMGRLEPEKGFDKLIEAFHRVAKDCPGWNLLIVGEGSLRMELAGLVASLGLADRVALPGRVRNPRSLFRQCDLFALSSESEGFGLVLLEAMSAGLPVVSFDCDFGPREIIAAGVSGVLVPAGDVPALSRAIRKLANDEGLRGRLASRGLATVGRFSPNEIGDRWEAMLRRICEPVTALPQVRPVTQAAERS
jgi:glycosyltransferase involved in cell wall biosynthesis